MELAHFGKRMVLCLLVLAVGVSFCYGDEVDLLLKRLNKTPLISIKSADGDIIDCVDISKQPAFDHPSLEAHSIQRRPSNHPKGSIGKKKASTNGGIKQTWHSNGMCPEETIPIRRTTKEDILRATSLKSFGKKHHRSMAMPASAKTKKGVSLEHEYALAYIDGDITGTYATINVWNPKVQHSNEFSSSQIWVFGGNFAKDVNAIEAGWHVNPGLYGDNKARLFIYWTTDNYNSTGCYNLLCPGFVQTNNEIVLGGAIYPVSSYEGPQYDITIRVWKDPQDGNWTLVVGDITLGHWPSKLFSHLNGSANLVEWGGEIVNAAVNGTHTTTEMGSGHFPNQGYGKASYVNNVLWWPWNPAHRNLGTLATYPNCYNISIISTYPNSYDFFYGGPGGNDPGCP